MRMKNDGERLPKDRLDENRRDRLIDAFYVRMGKLTHMLGCQSSCKHTSLQVAAAAAAAAAAPASVGSS